MPSAVFKSYHYHAIVKSRRFSTHSGRVYHYLALPEKVFKEMRFSVRLLPT
jgi:hypothetical protein